MRLFSLLTLFVAACASTLAAPSQLGRKVEVTAKPIVLNGGNPQGAVLGRLHYLGGLELESAEKRFGGFSSLKWRAGRLYAVNDIGDWAELETDERSNRLVGLLSAKMGDLLGPSGETLEGSATGDAEALEQAGDGWLVGFEHEHKVLRYRTLGTLAERTELDPQAIFGDLEDNQGVEALAVRGGRLFICVERLATDASAHCYIRSDGGTQPVRMPVPARLDPRTAFPVDADWGADGTLYVLFRSWSGGSDNRAAIVARSPLGRLQTIATFLPPVAVDNYEGLALREEGSRTFLYIISDDNFGVYDDPKKADERQRTLLMKFELIG